MPSWKRKQPPVAKPEWVKEFTATIIEQVKKQEAPFQLPWKSGGRPHIPQNFATGRPYQGGNTLYLMAVARKRDMADKCAEHGQQLGSESLLPNLMGVKG